MTRKEAIQIHNSLVEKRAKIAKQLREGANSEIEKELSQLTREIGHYGNAFNERISEKDRATLALTD